MAVLTEKCVTLLLSPNPRLFIGVKLTFRLIHIERQRLENIKKNQSLLSSLAIKSVGPAANKGQTRPSSSSTSTPTKKRSRPAASTDSLIPAKRHVTRSSVRLGGVTLHPVELQSRLEKQEVDLELERKKKNELNHSDRPFVHLI
ncbi:hypothetical protein MJO28_004016 [Puccinia striiformis f. sp. tritici]|uniref:Uncharacterized protein n=1 Tax=Puccinia striiformis f. sp. tritici TaxID=168172 RepID=A0ACC0EN83_9BASI|nr:hypothetical protein MJO28_004016 [Puccinia striiformis f. sp. tritici]